MAKINRGGCECKDCNNGEYSIRAYEKRLWLEEVEAEQSTPSLAVDAKEL